jgi:hypothetical protein
MLAFLFVAIAVAVRFLPHTFHFTPVGAALLFFGAKQDRKWMWLPVLALAVSDVILNKFVYHYPVTAETFVSSAWYISALLIGTLMKKATSEKFDFLVVAAGALSGATSFFVISNLGVWALTPMYPHTLDGLVTCFAMAIPFFGGTFAADVIYTFVFFATPVLIAAVKKQMSEMGSDDVAAA